MNNSHNANAALDQFRIEIGDTERPVEDIIIDIKSYGEPIVFVKLDAKAAGPTASGSVITIEVTPNSVDEQGLKNKLNEAGGCMYQVVSVTKVTER